MVKEVVGLASIENGGLLVLVENGEAIWTFPGGKKESGEDDSSCLLREIKEELGDKVRVLALSHYKSFTGVAPNKGYPVEAIMYFGQVTGEIEPGTDIAQVRRVTLSDCENLTLSALTRQIVNSLSRDGYNIR